MKPENFLIDRNGHIILADFGLSSAGSSKLVTNALIRNHAKGEENIVASSVASTRAMIPSEMVTFLTRSHNSVKFSTLLERKLVNQDRTYSMVGSPDYMSQEMLAGIRFQDKMWRWMQFFDLFGWCRGRI